MSCNVLYDFAAVIDCYERKYGELSERQFVSLMGGRPPVCVRYCGTGRCGGSCAFEPSERLAIHGRCGERESDAFVDDAGCDHGDGNKREGGWDSEQRRLCDSQHVDFVGKSNDHFDAAPCLVSCAVNGSGSSAGSDEEKEKRKEGKTRLNIPTHEVVEVSSARGPNWLRNKASRDKKKRQRERAREEEEERKKKNKKKTMSFSWRARDGEDQEFIESEKKRKRCENELAAEKARRSLVALNALSIDDQIRCNRVKMQATVERKLVSIEKDHNRLVKTGNVPRSMMTESEEAGYAQTISSSISPNSSASMAEFRAQQKALLDAQEEIEKLKEQLGLGLKIQDPYAKSLWTDTSENRRVLDDIYYDGYGEVPDYCGSGKMRIIPV